MCIDIIMWLVGLDTSEILSRTQKIQNLKNYFHNTISHCEVPAAWVHSTFRSARDPRGMVVQLELK